MVQRAGWFLEPLCWEAMRQWWVWEERQKPPQWWAERTEEGMMGKPRWRQRRRNRGNWVSQVMVMGTHHGTWRCDLEVLLNQEYLLNSDIDKGRVELRNTRNTPNAEESALVLFEFSIICKERKGSNKIYQKPPHSPLIAHLVIYHIQALSEGATKESKRKVLQKQDTQYIQYKVL